MVAAVGSSDNTTVTVEGQVSYNWAEPVESSDKKAKLMNKRPPSDTSLEAFYDFAHEVGSGGKEREKTEGARLDGAVYEEVKAESDVQPSNSNSWTKESTYDVPRPVYTTEDIGSEPAPTCSTNDLRFIVRCCQ